MPIQYDDQPITLGTGQRHVIQIGTRILRVRLTGMLFETDKTFLLPKAMNGIRGLVGLYDEHPGMAAVVTGHTDRVGGPSYNLGLSDERARSITHYLRDEVDDWLTWYTDQPYSRAWGIREDQYMLSAITDEATGHLFYAGLVHGSLDVETQDAVLSFQASRGLTVDGLPGPQTRRALVTDYMNLDRTTLPEGTEVRQLGCGEHHNRVSTDDGVDEPENRRAEIFLFDPPPVDPAVPGTCPGAGCPYETWKERVVETYDFEDEPAHWDVFDFQLHVHRGEQEHGAEA